MNQKERIQRLHHQLGVIYGRVFLTGDWRGDDWKQIPDTKLSEDIATNIFEDQKVVEASDLVDGLTDFLRDAGQTVPARLNHEDLMTTEGRNDFNRALFLKVLALARDILKQSLKDVNLHDDLELSKCMEENIHYFRDMSLHPEKSLGIKGLQTKGSDVGNDNERAAEGLANIRDRLRGLLRGGGNIDPDPIA